MRLELLVCLLWAAPALAQDGVVHRAQDGETYEFLAQFYYGRKDLARHLEAYNRRPVTAGAQLTIPTYRHLPLPRGETLQSFAQAQLNDGRRADYWVLLHGIKEDRVKPGTPLRVVPSLAHKVQRGDSYKTLAALYYGESSERRQQLLMRFNPEIERPKVGATIRVPLDLPEMDRGKVLARLEKPHVAKAPPPAEPKPIPEPEKPKERPKTDERRNLGPLVEKAQKLYDDGAYARCVDMVAATHSEAAGSPHGPELLRLEGFALVALGRPKDARERFERLLRLAPNYQLDLKTTSPKILDVFESVAER